MPKVLKSVAVSIAVTVAVAIAVTVIVSWLGLRGTKVDFAWCPNWPATVRGEGEASERILAGPGGKVTEADRARAKERARWKAYYYAQLRVAEQLGRLKLDAKTVIKDMTLTDQQLVAAYQGVIHAAVEVPGETKVTIKGDVATARVVVEAPAQRVRSLREALVAALRSGRITVTLPAGGEPQGLAATTEASAKQQEAQAEPTRPADTERHGKKPAAHLAKPAKQPASAPAPAASPASSGWIVAVDPGSGFIGASPAFYDAAGRELGSALDLPQQLVAEGIPVASKGDADRIRQIAGDHPARSTASVTKGNLIVHQKLDAGQASAFKESVKQGHLVIVLEEATQ